MKAALIAVGYSAPFLLFVLIPLSLRAIFVAVYATIVLSSLALPLANHELTRVLTNSLYKGLAGAAVGLAAIAIYLEYFLGLFRQYSIEIVAATWVFFSLIFPAASALSVFRLGAILKQGGLERSKNLDQFPTGAQHFALEYCAQRWFRHGNFLLLSLASFAMYFYGWFLLGFPFLLYSVALLLLSSLLLVTLSRRFLAPFTPGEIIKQIERKDPKAVPKEH